ncbi:hypothetical protein E2320_013672 [Naja naja]|nr:hypothetical protein E2320_013672 [Naja naja]
MFNSLLSSFLFQKYSPSPRCWESKIFGHPLSNSKNTHHVLGVGKFQFLAALFPIRKNTHHLLGVGKVQFLAALFSIPKILTISWLLAKSDSWPNCLLFKTYSPSPGCWQSANTDRPLSYSKNTHHLLCVDTIQFLAVLFLIPKVLTISCVLAKSNSWTSCFLFQKYSPCPGFWQSPIPGHPVSYSKNTHHVLAFGKVQFLAILFPIPKILTTSWVLGNPIFPVLFPIPKILTISWVFGKSNSWPSCLLFQKYAPFPGCWQCPIPGSPISYSKNIYHLLCVDTIQFIAILFLIPKVRFLAKLFAIQNILTISWYSPFPVCWQCPIPGHPVSYSKNTHHLLTVDNVQFLAVLFLIPKILTISWLLAMSNSWLASFLLQNTHHLRVLAFCTNTFSGQLCCLKEWNSPFLGRIYQTYRRIKTHRPLHLLNVGNVQFLAVLFPVPKIITISWLFGNVQFLAVLFPIPKILTISWVLWKSNFWLSFFRSKNTHHISWLLAMSNSWLASFLFEKYPPSPECWQGPIPGSPSTGFWQSPIPSRPVSYSKNTHQLMGVDSLFAQFQKYHLLAFGKVQFLAILFPIPKMFSIFCLLAKSNFSCPVSYSKSTHHLLGVGQSPIPGRPLSCSKKTHHLHILVFCRNTFNGQSNSWPSCFLFQKYSSSPGSWQSPIPGHPVTYSKNTHHLLDAGKVQFLASFLFQKYSPSPGFWQSPIPGHPVCYSKNTHHLLCVDNVQFLAVLFPIPKILTISWVLGKSDSWPSCLLFKKYSPSLCVCNVQFIAVLFPIPKYSPFPVCWQMQILTILFPIPKILTDLLSFGKVQFLAILLPIPKILTNSSCPIPGCPLSDFQNTHHLLGVGNVQFLEVVFPIPKILTISWVLAKSNSWKSSFLFQRYSPSPVFWQSPIFPVLFPIPKILTISWVLAKSNSWPSCLLFQKYSPSPGFWQSPIPGQPVCYSKNTHHLLGVGIVPILTVLFPIPKILTISWVLAKSNSWPSCLLFQKYSPCLGCWQCPIPGSPISYSKNTHHLLCVDTIQFIAVLFPIPKVLTISCVLAKSTSWPSCLLFKKYSPFFGVGKVQILTILFPIPKILTDLLSFGKVQFLAILFPIPKILTIS